jgi:hypothetical protein
LRRPRRCRSRCGRAVRPASRNRREEPELAKDYWVRNIHDPSLTVCLPRRAKATGTGVVIFPGGGHRLLVFKAEADDPARSREGSTVSTWASGPKLRAVQTWSQRLADWLADRGLLEPVGAAR